MAHIGQGLVGRATTQFATVGYAVTKTWAAAHPKTLAAFYTALEEGQEIADTDRAAVEEAMEDLPTKPVPLGVPRQVASVMTIPYFRSARSRLAPWTSHGCKAKWTSWSSFSGSRRSTSSRCRWAADEIRSKTCPEDPDGCLLWGVRGSWDA